VRSRTVNAFIGESVVAAGLAAIQDRFGDVEIGSYPFVRQERFGCALVARSVDLVRLAEATEAIAALVRGLGVEPQISDGESPPSG
jgi:hypothetical protein